MSGPNQHDAHEKEGRTKGHVDANRQTTQAPKVSTCANSLATRLEGRHVKQPDAREYARYDRQKEAELRIQIISERLTQVKRQTAGKGGTRTQVHSKHTTGKRVQTPEEVAAAAAVVAAARQSNEGGTVSPRSSNDTSVSGPNSRELSSNVNSSAEEWMDDSSITDSMKTAMVGCKMKYLRMLGRGTYGQVVLVDYEKHLKAVKLIEIEAHEFRFLRRILRREMHVHSNVKPHPHLVSIEKVLRFGRIMLLSMPYASNGDLYEYIRRKGYLNEISACRLFHQLCSAVEHLHCSGFAHRDLKCENVLLDHNLNIKLTDFGFTCALKSAPKIPESSMLNTQMSHSDEQCVLIWSLEDVRKRQANQATAAVATSEKPSTDINGSKSIAIEASSTKQEANKNTSTGNEKNGKPLDKSDNREAPNELTLSLDRTTCTKSDINKDKLEADLITVYRKCDLKEADLKAPKNTRIMSEDNEVQFTQTHCGTLMYACPELLNRELYDPRAADVWSLGVILWVMLFNCYPYNDRRAAVLSLAANTCIFEIPSRPPVSDPCKSLIRKMLVKEDFRVRMPEVMDSEWIEKNKHNFKQDITAVDSSGVECRPSLSYRQNTGTFDL